MLTHDMDRRTIERTAAQRTGLPIVSLVDQSGGGCRHRVIRPVGKAGLRRVVPGAIGGRTRNEGAGAVEYVHEREAARPVVPGSIGRRARHERAGAIDETEEEPRAGGLSVDADRSADAGTGRQVQIDVRRRDAVRHRDWRAGRRRAVGARQAGVELLLVAALVARAKEVVSDGKAGIGCVVAGPIARGSRDQRIGGIVYLRRNAGQRPPRSPHPACGPRSALQVPTRS